MKTSGKILLAAVVGGLAAVAIALLIRSGSADLPVLGTVPEFTFMESGEKPFGSREMRGRVSVVDFIFTNCPGICPLMGANMQRLYTHFTRQPEVQLVSISVDPQRDTLTVLRQYAVGWGVTDGRWVFLSGELDDVVQLCEQGFMLPADDLPLGHSSRFVLVDRQLQIRGYYDGTDAASVDSLRMDIERLLEKDA